jgi:DNA-directed RNA polymerase specialized sigma24 family protein
MPDSPDRRWVDRMDHAIQRCAPLVVRSMARFATGLPNEPDLSALAGHVIISVATAACAERWTEADFETRTEGTIARALDLDLDAPPLPTAFSGLRGHGRGPIRRAVGEALDSAAPGELQLLSLILNEGLSAAEVAGVMGCTVDEVHEGCRQAVARIRERLAVPEQSVS